MKVRIASSDPAKVRSLKERYSLSLLAATILERRGVESGEDMMYFLDLGTANRIKKEKDHTGYGSD